MMCWLLAASALKGSMLSRGVLIRTVANMPGRSSSGVVQLEAGRGWFASWFPVVDDQGQVPGEGAIRICLYRGFDFLTA